MNLRLKGFSQLVQDMSASLQSSATALVDVSVGSVIRAIFEANASVVLWMQWLVLQVLQTTRASTSVGSDLDSWMADFGLLRLPATAATGIVTFSRYTPSLAATIPIGTILKTADGSLSFSVVADYTLSIWQSATSSYVIPSGVASADVPVICAAAGSAGNVLAGSINVIASSLPGIDQVSNASPLSDGEDSETDQSFRGRFRNYLATRSRATVAAIRNAVASVRQGLGMTILENTSTNGAPSVGAFTVIVDDGSGYPSADLLSTVASAVDAVRPIGTAFAIVPPQVLTVSVSLTAKFSSSGASTLGIPNIQNQVAAYLNSLPIGATASITRVAQRAYETGPTLLNVSGITLNGGSVDLTASAWTVVKAGQIGVSVQ